MTRGRCSGLNNKRRDLLKSAIMYLDRASNMVSAASEQEQDCLDNMPENLQMSEQCERMEAAIDYLEDAVSHIDEARSKIEEASA